MVINSRGYALAVERARPRGAWQLPQGGIEAGESCLEAAHRELREEVGARPADVECLVEHPVWLGYELPPSLRSPKTGRGQVHRWFLFRFRATDAAITLVGSPELASWRWMTVAELTQLTADFRRPVYEALQATFKRHLAT
jgi:putative (di)nucleoside polyphosphate hydrolase